MQRPEELEWAGFDKAGPRAYKKGEMRGPGWYRVQRAESDTPRLQHLLRKVVSTIRFGNFWAAPGEMCTRCKFRAPCLTDGYKPIGEDKKQLELLTRRFDFDGFNDADSI